MYTMRTVAIDNPERLSVFKSVSMSVTCLYAASLCKHGLTDPVWIGDSWGPKNIVLDGSFDFPTESMRFVVIVVIFILIHTDLINAAEPLQENFTQNVTNDIFVVLSKCVVTTFLILH